ncbi:MAG: glycosyltransferase family 39 protein [Candidatus Hydrogenedentota bacterium]
MITFGALIAAAYVLGDAAGRLLRIGGTWEDHVLRWTAGTALAGLIAMIVGAWSLQAASAVLYLLAALGLAAEVFAGRHTIPDSAERAPRASFDMLEKASLAAIAGALLLTFLAATAPVTGWEASVAHMALASDYAREGRIHLQPGNVYAACPHLAQSLYAVAFLSGGELAATWLNWFFGALSVGAVAALGVRVAGRRAGLVAAALYAAAPIFMDQAAAPSVDLALAALATAALCALVRWYDTGRLGALLVSALLAGSSCGARHTGYVVVAFLVAGVLAGGGRRRYTAAGIFVLMATLAAAPWLVRSALLAGNPFFPLLHNVFPSEFILYTAEAGIGVHTGTDASGPSGLTALLRFPWDIIMQPYLYDGWPKSPGGMVLVLGVPGLFLGGRRVRWLGAYGAAGVGVFFFFQRLARYMLPFFIPLHIAAGAAADRVRVGRRLVWGVVMLAFVYHLMLHAGAMHFKVPVLLGMESRTEYLEARIDRYPAFAWANTHLRDGTLLTPDQRTFYLRMPTYQNHAAMAALANMPRDAQLAWLREHNIRYVLVPWDYLETSPALASELLPMFRQWRNDTQHFDVIESMLLARPGGRIDRVDFLEVRDE